MQCYTGWVGTNMGIFFGLLRVLGLFRVDAKSEEEGLDHSYHGGSAYGATANEKPYTYSKVSGTPLSSQSVSHHHPSCCSAEACAAQWLFWYHRHC
jgi:hypothetical protein